MKKDEYIRVKTGTIDPDFKDMDLSGFTGYLEDDPGNDNLVCIIWDNDTLKNFDEKFVSMCDKQNLDHTRMVLAVEDIESID